VGRIPSPIAARSMRRTIAVTGATGWLGQAAVATALAHGHKVIPFASRARGGIRDLRELPDVEHDVLLHYAYVTRDALPAMRELDFVRANAAITHTVVAAIKRHKPDVFFASSGAAAFAGASGRSEPYAEQKARDEALLREVSGARCAVARIFSVGGPYVMKSAVFLLTDLISQALYDPEIKLVSSRLVYRSYADVEDIAEWALRQAGSDLMVPTAGDKVIEAVELAEMVRDLAGGHKPIVRAEVDREAAPDHYAGDEAAWRSSCSAVGLTPRPTEVVVARTVQWLRQQVKAQHGSSVQGSIIEPTAVDSQPGPRS
jgi:nucleoside-diphosphate-sugar epimerase